MEVGLQRFIRLNREALHHLLVPDGAKARKDGVFVKQRIERRPQRPLVGERHEELVDNEVVVDERPVVRENPADLGRDVLSEAVPVGVGAECLRDSELISVGPRKQPLYLLRPVRIETALRPFRHSAMERTLGERLLATKVIEEKIERASLRRGVGHRAPSFGSSVRSDVLRQQSS